MVYGYYSYKVSVRPKVRQKTLLYTTYDICDKIKMSEAALHKCSENMQQIYTRKAMRKFDFDKAA